MISRNATVLHLAGRVLPLATLYFDQIWTVQVRMDRTGIGHSSERHRHLSYLDNGPWVVGLRSARIYPDSQGLITGDEVDFQHHCPVSRNYLDCPC
jgi:hypothetical protein